MLDEEIEALGLLAYKRGLLYESKKDSLRQDIDRLRNFLVAMAKDRELMQKQAKAEHILCKKKLAQTEKELQDTKDRLRHTESEAAYLLESKQIEMDRLQKEKDQALAKLETLRSESSFFKGYSNHLERKVCALVVKLHEYHQELQQKAEEVVQSRGRAVDEWEWIRQSISRFEDNLSEFQNANSQLLLEKESCIKEIQDMKQLERINSDKLNEELAQTENQLHLARLKIGDLQGKLQNMEQNFQNASQRAEIIASQFDEANARISGLHEQIDKLHGQLETLQGKNLDFMKDKLEADAATHVREAAISVLKLRIYALEAIDVEMRAKGSNTVDNLKLREDSSLCYSAPEVGLETSKKQQNESNEVSFKGKKVQSEIHWSENPVLEEHKNDVWNLKELRKLEQGTADVHQKYMNLDKGIKAEKMKPCKSSETDCHRTRFADGSHTQQDTHPSENVKSHGRHQNSCVNVEDECVSRSSNVNQLLWSRSLQHSSLEIAKTSNGLENTCYREWISHRLHQVERSPGEMSYPFCNHERREDCTGVPIKEWES
ncbi:hypothetical protein KP509_33G043700 [Ceratopteris richardii]|uniref:Uncharacterized protein n=1 Tax=Ceratopteris richardii TaxID=49495 RepID=A0A8T2QP20_CERRI|nr:hypothetical protein KP509_33G043700 [Ceratopteris richardii]